MNGNGVMRTALTRDQILAATDSVIEAVEVPEWGGLVYVRNLKGRARDQFEGSRYRMKGDKVEVIHENTRAKLLSLCLCDEAGNLLFTEQDVWALGEKNAAVLDRLFETAQRLSALRPKDVEDRVKNSVSSPSDTSGMS